MAFEDNLRVILTVGRRVQLLEKEAHDLYWEIDALAQKMQKDEVERQKQADAAKAAKAKAKPAAPEVKR